MYSVAADSVAALMPCMHFVCVFLTPSPPFSHDARIEFACSTLFSGALALCCVVFWFGQGLGQQVGSLRPIPRGFFSLVLP